MAPNTSVTLQVKWNPGQVNNKWLDLFEYHVNSRDGLPPSARAEAVIVVMKRLNARRRAPCLHVVVDSPGRWYTTALNDSLRGYSQPIAIKGSREGLTFSDFYRMPGLFPVKPAAPDFRVQMFDESLLNRKERSKLQILRNLARVSFAGTKEIASLAGLSHTYARKLLPELVLDRFVEYHNDGFGGKARSYPVWEIKRAGVQYVHQSWNIPGNMKFRGVRAEQKYAGQKHRKIARLWRAWLTKAYESYFEIWQVWPELALESAYPDALAWGSYDGVETLAWLEVESGKKSRKDLAKDIVSRFILAKKLAEWFEIQIIFVVLAQPWVLRSLATHGFFIIPENVALAFENWRNFGSLPEPIFGKFNSMSEDGTYPLVKDFSKELLRELGFPERRFSAEIFRK